jgi:hypothetical protein
MLFSPAFSYDLVMAMRYFAMRYFCSNLSFITPYHFSLHRTHLLADYNSLEML